jgi:hypothetical protein
LRLASFEILACPWHDIRIIDDAGGRWRNISSKSCHGEQMGEVIQFIPRKPDPDQKARLIQEARAIYESIFPTEDAGTAPMDDDASS